MVKECSFGTTICMQPEISNCDKTQKALKLFSGHGIVIDKHSDALLSIKYTPKSQISGVKEIVLHFEL